MLATKKPAGRTGTPRHVFAERRPARNGLSAVAFLAIAAFAMGCDDSGKPEHSAFRENETPVQRSAEPAPNESGGARSAETSPNKTEMDNLGMRSPNDAKPASKAERAPSMNDVQILGALDAMSAKEIEVSRVVSEVTKNKDVKELAEKMIRHHSDAMAKTKTLAASIGAGTTDAPETQKLLQDTSYEVERLKGMSGPDLDKAYVDLMVADHKAALDLVDQQLLTSVQSPELKNLIQQELRPTIEAHFQEAQALAMQLGPTRTTALEVR